jgi:hypothetical protein
MKQRMSRQNAAVRAAMRSVTVIGGISALVASLGLAGCEGTAKVRECLPISEYVDLKSKLNALEGQSEYDILGTYGKPKNISMNTRSEKEYIYHACEDNTGEKVVVRFGSTGRVKEVYLKN